MIARVYQAINAVSGALAQDGVPKTRLNARDNYLFRSIDDVLERLAPLLAQHRLCILPRVLEREVNDRQDESGTLLVAVALKVAFDLVSAEDGSSHTIEAYGEALDAGDKATAKAMQSAFKYAVLQAFCVPAARGEDADAGSYRLRASAHPPEPKEGWTRWCEALQHQLRACRSDQAVRALQDAHRSHLSAIQRERPELYSGVGRAISARRSELKIMDDAESPAAAGQDSASQCATEPPHPVRRKRSSRSNGSGAHG